MSKDLGREIVVMFNGICGLDWEKECRAMFCKIEIYADGIYVKTIGYNGIEYGQELEFKSFSQVTLEFKKEESKFLFFKKTSNYLHISVDYTPNGGEIINIPSIIVTAEDMNRIKNMYNYYKQKSLALTIQNNQIIENIDIMNGIEFEEFVGDLFSRMGYKVEFTKTTGDQGVDLLLYKNNKSIAVQTKCYSSTVGNSAVQQVVSGKHFYKCSEGMVVTNNHFTNSAIQLANSTGTILWDKEKLYEMIQLLY